MNTIKVKCRTNIDDYDCSLITEFAALPRLGDYVTVFKKGVGGGERELKIVRITHSRTDNSSFTIPMEPMLKIELGI